MTADLISRARAGDGDAFRELTEPHRRELRVHCYRMLGSFQDADDALQEALLAAWQGIGGFEGRASLRSWLYRIATNRSLNARRSASRRPAQVWNIPGVEPPEPTRLGEVVWLEPFPDAFLEGAIDEPPGPEARYEQTESISLAFVTALQVLPPRQVAVLILRDVLGFHASEVAGMLESTVESVNSALKRARASTQRRRPPTAGRQPPRPPDSASEDAIVAKFVSAYESADLDALVALLTDDVFISMPPMPIEYEGRDVVARFCGSIFGAGRRFDLVRTRANGQPAFGAYLRAASGTHAGVGLIVLTLSGDRICAMTRFDHNVFQSFGLPRSLPSRSPAFRPVDVRGSKLVPHGAASLPMPPDGREAMAATDFEILDPRFGGCVKTSARVEKLFEGCRWAEGPAWFAAGRYLVWSDIPNDRILRWDEPTGTVGVFRDPAGYTNGHTVDRQGPLVSCEHGGRRVSRTEHDGSITTVADRYQGKRLNSPNDVVVKSDGSIWFTDPEYGIESDYEGHMGDNEIGACHVYRVDPADGRVSIAADDFVRPNGLAFSPDERLLYISDTGASQGPDLPRHIRVFRVEDDGRLTGGSVFATCTVGFFDGFRLDEAGRIWTSAGDGVHCYDPDGTLIGKVLVPEAVANVAWGGAKRNRLFICGTTSLYSVMLPVNGARTY